MVGVLLVRLGGHAAGVFSGTRLVDSKVGSRNVHGRHRAGGSSQKRFERRRGEQARVALEAAADVAARVLLPHRRDLDAVVLGGDRRALAEVLEDPRLRPLASLVAERVLDVPDPRLKVLRTTPDMFRATIITVSPHDRHRAAGAGFMADTHAAATRRCATARRVRVVCGLEAGPCERNWPRGWAPRRPTTSRRALAVPGVDAVDVCLATPLHRQVAESVLKVDYARAAREAARPLARRRRRDRRGAEASGRVLTVGHELRFMPENVDCGEVLGAASSGWPLGGAAAGCRALPD